MRRNQKGFTLIELLAVIVILAVIALIATPLIMNVINSAMQKMALDPTYSVPGTCDITDDKTKCGTLAIDYKGTQPVSAHIIFDTAKGSVAENSTVTMNAGTFTLQADGSLKKTA